MCLRMIVGLGQSHEVTMVVVRLFYVRVRMNQAASVVMYVRGSLLRKEVGDYIELLNFSSTNLYYLLSP